MSVKKNEVFENLLELLREHPEIVREIVLDAVNLKPVLKKLGARDPTTNFLKYVASEKDGYNIVQFLHNTSSIQMCAKGTHSMSCLRNTTPSRN